MKKMNKKGFTLIELLAVIVVLAIVMVIATQKITDVVNNSRANAFISSYKSIIKQVKTNIVGDPDNIECTSEKTNGKNLCTDVYDISGDYKLNVTDESTYYQIELEVAKEGKDYIGKFKNLNLIKSGDAINNTENATKCTFTKIGSGAVDCTEKSITGKVEK